MPALLTCHVVVETLVIFVLPEMILLRPEIIMILPGMLLILPGLIVTCWHRPYTVPPPHHDQNRGQTWKWSIFNFVIGHSSFRSMWIRSTWPDRLCVKFESLWVLLACVGLVALLSQLAWSEVSVFCDYIGLGEGSSDVWTFLHFSWAPGPPRWDSVGTWSPQNNSSSSRAPRCLTHS